MTFIRVSLLSGDLLRQGTGELIDEWRRDSGDRLWVDIQNPAQEIIEPLLEERFGFHELAAEDTLSANTLPKYDSFSTHDFFIFRTVDVDLHEHATDTRKVAAFLGSDFLVTVHRRPLEAIDGLFGRLSADRRLLANGPDFLLHSIVDAMVDAHFPVVEEIEDCVEELQEKIFESAQNAHMDELLHLKRDLSVLRRHSLPQRELLNQISRGDAKFIQRQHLIYFRDVYDHMYRISETIDIARDQMGSTMEAYLSVVANRTNEIMKLLTFFSAVMLPMTLITGFYGMNFDYMPGLRSAHGWWVSVALMIAAVVLMLAWFLWKGWIAIPQRTRRHKHGGQEV